MRITNCQTIVTCPGRNFVIVKIETDTGLVGWGDATLNGRELAVDACLREHLFPMLIGEDPLRIEHIWQALFIGAYWRGGPVQNTALAGIDMALWDILGKEAGQPVYQLLGGRTREGAMAYTNVAATTPQKVAEGVKKRMAEGFKALRIQLEVTSGSVYGEKLRPSQGERDGKAAGESKLMISQIEQSLPLVGEWEPTPYMRALPKLFAGVRAEVGDGVELLHDVHQRLSPIQAAALAREIEPYHPFFYEDPVAPEHKEGLAFLRQACPIPIAIGELFTDISQCLPIITNRWVDYLRCDLGHIGGITAARKLALLSEPFAIRTAWHGPPDLAPIGHAANVHVDVSVSNFGIQEWFNHYDWMVGGTACREVFIGAPALSNGMLNVSDRPGLGIDVNETAARKYLYKRAYLPVVRRADGSVHPW